MNRLRHHLIGSAVLAAGALLAAARPAPVAMDARISADRLASFDAIDVHVGCELLGAAPSGPQPPAGDESTPPPGGAAPAGADPVQQVQQPPLGPPHSELPPPEPPSLTARFARGAKGARATRLVVHRVPVGGTVTVRCRAPRRAPCPFRASRTRHRDGADRLDLRPRLHGRLRPYGTVVTVRVGDPDDADTVRRVTVRRANRA